MVDWSKENLISKRTVVCYEGLVPGGVGTVSYRSLEVGTRLVARTG